MNRHDILKEFGITDIAQVTTPAEDMADEIVHLRRKLARKYTRIAWLSNELEHSSYLVSMASTYRRHPTPENQTFLFHAVRQYWTDDLDDDGTEPGEP